jgi:hypothetical protein
VEAPANDLGPTRGSPGRGGGFIRRCPVGRLGPGVGPPSERFSAVVAL